MSSQIVSIEQRQSLIPVRLEELLALPRLEIETLEFGGLKPVNAKL